MLFFSRSRADLGLTLIIAALLALLTLVLFKLDDDVQLVSIPPLPLCRFLSHSLLVCVSVCVCLGRIADCRWTDVVREGFGLDGV